MSGDSDRRFADIEREICDADPTFMARTQRAVHLDKFTKVAMALLLQLGTVVMVFGLAMKSIPWWAVGLTIVFLAPLLGEVLRVVEHRDRPRLDRRLRR